MSPWIMFLVATLFSTPFDFNSEGGIDDMSIREVFEKTITEKLENPKTTAYDIKNLAIAYSELTKNDHMKELTEKFGQYSGFNGPSPIPTDLQLADTPKGASE